MLVLSKSDDSELRTRVAYGIYGEHFDDAIPIQSIK